MPCRCTVELSSRRSRTLLKVHVSDSCLETVGSERALALFPLCLPVSHSEQLRQCRVPSAAYVRRITASQGAAAGSAQAASRCPMDSHRVISKKKIPSAFFFFFSRKIWYEGGNEELEITFNLTEEHDRIILMLASQIFPHAVLKINTQLKKNARISKGFFKRKKIPHASLRAHLPLLQNPGPAAPHVRVSGCVRAARSSRAQLQRAASNTRSKYARHRNTEQK